MRSLVAAALVLCSSSCLAQLSAAGGKADVVYPEEEVSAVWHALGAAYVRKALDDRTLDRDPGLNARIDAVTAKVAEAVAAVDARFPPSYWRTILVEGFGHGATAFPGGTLIVDAKFVRRHQVTDEELALIIAHEMAHVVAGHASEKLSFMAGLMGTNAGAEAQLPSARAALIAFFTSDGHADAFRPIALKQEREADRVGAVFLLKSGYDPQRALLLFDKLAASERTDPNAGAARGADTHDSAAVRKQLVLRAIEAQF